MLPTAAKNCIAKRRDPRVSASRVGLFAVAGGAAFCAFKYAYVPLFSRETSPVENYFQQYPILIFGALILTGPILIFCSLPLVPTFCCLYHSYFMKEDRFEVPKDKDSHAPTKPLIEDNDTTTNGTFAKIEEGNNDITNGAPS